MLFELQFLFALEKVEQNLTERLFQYVITQEYPVTIVDELVADMMQNYHIHIYDLKIIKDVPNENLLDQVEVDLQMLV